ncbi:MAG TPA: prolyl oligopeptidase family serine peptidase [Burkholderiaceae bacterium]|nr:prolyl oligopeptidase family serine peptidase [Burkholderiaceae bacterium]
MIFRGNIFFAFSSPRRQAFLAEVRFDAQMRNKPRDAKMCRGMCAARFAIAFAGFVALPAPFAAPIDARTIAALAPTHAGAGDGEIVDRQRCALPFQSYEAWIAFIREKHRANGKQFDEARFRSVYPAADFERLHDGSVQCWDIVYRSQGLKIAGYLVGPQDRDRGPPPVIIYNRGGNRDYGRLVLTDLIDFAGWARHGFLVLASQYRGATGSEGSDEFGGADVNDVLSLFPLARSIGADMRNVFMVGFSRGGLMTYLALKRGAVINAAVVIGGPTDLALEAKYRPEMLALYRELMPDFDRRRHEHLRARRVIDFASRLDAPLLLLHGGADERVPPEQALALAQRLARLRKSFELVLYAGDDHSLGGNREDSRKRVLAWFRRHMK